MAVITSTLSPSPIGLFCQSERGITVSFSATAMPGRDGSSPCSARSSVTVAAADSTVEPFSFSVTEPGR